MKATTKTAGILSLSAASIALLQSAVPTQAQPSEGTPTDIKTDHAGPIILKTDNVVLEPPLHSDFNRLYAGHTSHASHSSHASGSGYSAPSTPYYPAYTPPATYSPPTTYPTPQPSTPRPAPVPTALAVTNAVSAPSPAEIASKRKAQLESLKKEAAQGSAPSQYALALYYMDGYGGCEKNVEKAKMLLELAAIQGNEDAKKALDKLDTTPKAEKAESEK